MAYSESVLTRARERLEQQCLQHKQEHTRRVASAYQACPRLRQIDRLLHLTAAKAVAASVSREPDAKQTIDCLRQENLALQQERTALLAGLGLEKDALDGKPLCPRCGDRGYIGSQMCNCLGELCRQEQKKDLTSLLSTGQERFENFSLDYYPDAYDPKLGASPRRIMQATLAHCRRYCASFSPQAESLLFSGATGLGKTFLSACIARQVADQGFSVVYETAVRLFGDFETEKFGDRSGDRVEHGNLTSKYLQTDLLIIDDLGTEMTTQFTISALYTVVNTRMMEAKPTIISTNLTPEALEGRYSPQIASRLLGTYSLFQFFGKDIRMQQQN